MEEVLDNISIKVNDKIYQKDPESSGLGRRIIAGSIKLIDELGFEFFTFKKLGVEIGSTEASVYRYFESKHKLLLYLTSWYWGWQKYRLAFNLSNIQCPIDRLERAIVLLTEKIKVDSSFSHINEVKLHHILISEASKAYLTKDVDQENKEGAFAGYKQVVQMVSNIILEINEDFKYPHMLVSTVIEGAHHQRYFSEHLPRLTDIIKGEDSITEFYKNMVFKTINT